MSSRDLSLPAAIQPAISFDSFGVAVRIVEDDHPVMLARLTSSDR